MEGSRATLVTGGAGFIGSHLVAYLLDAGHSVRVVDDFSTGLRERLEPFEGEIDLVQGSIVDPDVCAEACRDVEVVFHQAAIPSVQRSVEDPLATHAACATGTLNLLHAAHAAGSRRLVYAGSSSAYGDTPALPKRETMPANPRSPYAVAKLAGEQYTRVFPSLYGIESVVLRYFNVFGPGQDPNSLYSAVIPKFIACAFRGIPPIIYGDGEQTRDFTYIENVVQANLRAASVPADRVNGRVFNVGCGERVSVNTLWNEIRDLIGCDVEARFAPARSGDVRDSLAALDALLEALEPPPLIDLREGLRRTVEWFQSEHGKAWLEATSA